MKISDRNTALRYLREGGSMNCRIMDDVVMDEKARAFIFHVFPEMRVGFRERVQYLCKPFLDAFDQARSKLADVFTEEPLEQRGTFIMQFGDSRNGTIFYQLSAKALGGGNWEVFCTIVVFYNHPDYELPLIVAIIHRPLAGDDITFMDHHLGDGEMTPQPHVDNMLTLLLFMKYCQLETKIVEPGKRAYHVNQKYMNSSEQRVEILDSTWFTTIVRSEGFMVGAATGGFFRLQPCGPGLKDKKLIWIEPYEKKGYTRKAKMVR